MKTLGFRDPHAFARQETLSLGLEDQQDQPVLDAIDTLSRNQASYLRLLILRDLDSVQTLTKERFLSLIEMAGTFSLVEEPQTIH